MKYAITLLLLGIGCISLAYQSGAWAWVLIWCGVSFTWVAVAYGLNCPKMLGKLPTGEISIPHWPIVFPFTAFNWLLWWLRVLLSPEPVYHEILPGLYLGRRACVRELPTNITTVVDMTSELPAASGITIGRDYFCAPTLDGTPVSSSDMERLIDHITEAEAGIYIHCALGHGRSAMVVAAVMIAQGKAHNAEEAEAKLKQIRPGVGLNREQLRGLQSKFAPIKQNYN